MVSTVADNARPQPTITEIAAILADEGVPVRAIARATKLPGEQVYDILKSALSQGRLIELPRDDWPPGARTDRSPSDRKSPLSLDDTTLRIACASRFKLTKLQSAVFIALLRRNKATKEQLHNAVEASRSEHADPTDLKMVDVVICHIRRKTKEFNIDIKTIWGIGYSISAEHRTLILDLLADHLSGTPHHDLAAA